jgi:signal transduction histidine kinase
MRRRGVHDTVCVVISLGGRRFHTLDLGIAAALVAISETEVASERLAPYWASVSTFAVAMAALAWRRSRPLTVTLVFFTCEVAGAAFGVSQHKPWSPMVGVFVGMYSLALYAPTRQAIAGLVHGLACVYVAISLATHYGESYGGTDFGFIAAVLLMPWLVGKAMRNRVAEARDLAVRVHRAELEQERRAEEAAREERTRIARELHDVIAHSVSVMVVQAGAAEQVLRGDPERALEPLRAVQETGRAALAEMARLLGMLRRDGAELGPAPQPGLDDLGELVALTESAGLPVELHVEGSPRPLPLGADLSAYRIVQEALTNTRKHAGQAHATVTVRYTAEALELEIADDGDGTCDGTGGGNGLVGMRERVRLFGGDLSAGPASSGGFRVQARLPLCDPA